MLRKKYSYKDTNKHFTLRKRYSYIPPLQNSNYIKNTVNYNSTTKKPILNYSQRANLFINEDISMQTYGEIDDINEQLLDDVNYLEENDNYMDEEHSAYNEYTTDSDDAESQNESSEEERNIIDDALDPSKLQNNSDDFSPYFDNITTALLFCWIQKHNICNYTTRLLSLL